MSLAPLFTRDLLRFHQELAAFPADDQLWATLPGISNSAGHIALHLEGNLREFIGRRLGAVDYTRNRDAEFNGAPIPQAELLGRIEALSALVPPVLRQLTPEQLAAEYPQDFMGRPLATSEMLVHLYGHLNWHLGQIDYLRRILSASGAIPLATL